MACWRHEISLLVMKKYLYLRTYVYVISSISILSENSLLLQHSTVCTIDIFVFILQVLLMIIFLK